MANSNPVETQTPETRYKEEIRAALARDPQNIGAVWRDLEEGIEIKAIAGKIGQQAYNYRNILWSLMDARTPSTPSFIPQVVAALRSFTRRHGDLSEETKGTILDRAAEFERRLTDPDEIEEDDRRAQDRTERAERQGGAGIYAYSLPHYIRQPVVRVDGGDAITKDRTCFKIGRSNSDAIKRFRQQRTETVLPEAPQLFRIYTKDGIDDYDQIERRFHRHLEAAGHVRKTRPKGTGTEWFLTHLVFLDSTAELLDLEIVKVDEELTDPT